MPPVPIDPFSTGPLTFMASFPKSGRTWLRFMLCVYLNDALALGRTIDMQNMFDLIPNDDTHTNRGRGTFAFSNDPGVPHVLCTHRSHTEAAIAPANGLIFILRSPLDTLISYYFHLTKQYHEITMPLEEFLYHPPHGLPHFAQFTNQWAAALEKHPRHMVTTYERLHQDPRGVLIAALDFIQFPADRKLAAAAAEKSSFGEMQKVELDRGIRDVNYDQADADARRVRKGKIRGYRDYLTSAQAEKFHQELRKAFSPAAPRLYERRNLMINLICVCFGA